MRSIPATLLRYLNTRVLIGAWIFACVGFGGLLVILASARVRSAPHGMPTAILYVIPAATATPLAPLQTSQAPVTPTSQAPVPPPTGDISLGVFVQVFGTEGTGLRLRSEPGLASEVRFLAIENEVMQVTDGPRDVDGYTWWLVQAPYDQTVQGWAASNYLMVVPAP